MQRLDPDAEKEQRMQALYDSGVFKIVGQNRPEVALGMASVAREFHEDPEWLGLRLRNNSAGRFFRSKEEADILRYLQTINTPSGLPYDPRGDKRDARAQTDLGLRACIAKNYAVCVLTLLQNPYTNPSAHKNAAIRWASQYGHTFIVQQLLADARVDPSAKNNSAIALASRNGHTDVVRILLADPRVNPANTDALESASSMGHTEIVQLLLADPRVNPALTDALPAAVLQGHAEIVRLLLQDGRSDPRDTDILDEAIEVGSVEIVRLILQDGRMNPADFDFNALRLAASGGSEEILDVLLQDPRINDRGRAIANLGILEGGPMVYAEYEQARDRIARFL